MAVPKGSSPVPFTQAFRFICDIILCFIFNIDLCFFFRWAMSAGYGACLINKPEIVKSMVTLVRNQVDNPDYTVSIKIRYKKICNGIYIMLNCTSL